jgi:hypothetical protein
MFYFVSFGRGKKRFESFGEKENAKSKHKLGSLFNTIRKGGHPWAEGISMTNKKMSS